MSPGHSTGSDDCEIVNILLVDEVGEETNHNPVKIKGKLHLAKTLTTPLPLDFMPILK